MLMTDPEGTGRLNGSTGVCPATGPRVGLGRLVGLKRNLCLRLFTVFLALFLNLPFPCPCTCNATNWNGKQCFDEEKRRCQKK